MNYCLYLIKSFHQVTDYTHYSGPFCCHLREEKFTWQQSFIIHHYLEQEAWSPTLNKSAWNDSQKPLTQTIDTMLIYYKRKQTFISVSLITCCYLCLSTSSWMLGTTAGYNSTCSSSPYNYFDSGYHQGSSNSQHSCPSCHINPFLRWLIGG